MVEKNYLQNLIYWSDENVLEIGKVIYDNIQDRYKPIWAGEILNHCRTQHKPVKEIDNVFQITQDSRRWREAHQAFSEVRHLTQIYGYNSNAGKLFIHLLSVAELTAKVVYNSSGITDKMADVNNPAPFDEDSGEWLVKVYKEFADCLKDENFNLAAWEIVQGKKFY
jgi:hypothetical protein